MGIRDEIKQVCGSNFSETTEWNKWARLYQGEVENAEEGIYKIAYPREMLELAGVVVCGIRIIDSGDNIICATEDFSVEVMRSVFSGKMEVAENSIRVFDKMILDINAHERRVSVMELNFKELYKMLTTNIPNMDTTISSRASQTSVDKIDGKLSSLAKESSLTSIKSDLSTLKSRGCMKRVQRGEVTEKTKNWVEYDSRNLSFLYALNITLPYSVNVSKSKATVYFTNSNNSSVTVGVTCSLVGENQLRLVANRNSIYHDDKLSSGFFITWIVEEWY